MANKKHIARYIALGRSIEARLKKLHKTIKAELRSSTDRQKATLQKVESLIEVCAAEVAAQRSELDRMRE